MLIKVLYSAAALGGLIIALTLWAWGIYPVMHEVI
jgi:hypothetical protein